MTTSATPWGGLAVHLESTASTMDDARRLEDSGAPSGSLVRADFQTAGRGRWKTRTWVAPERSGLTFTIFWSPSAFRNLEFSPALTLAWAVANWLQPLVAPSCRVQVKWPNDVLVDHRKIAGILVQSRWMGERRMSLHCGIGVNLSQTEFPPDTRRPPCSLAQVGPLLSPEQALEGLLPHLAFALQLAEPIQGLERLLWKKGEQSEWEVPSQSGIEVCYGTVLGLGPQGQLRLATADGERWLTSGEQ